MVEPEVEARPRRLAIERHSEIARIRRLRGQSCTGCSLSSGTPEGIDALLVDLGPLELQRSHQPIQIKGRCWAHE